MTRLAVATVDAPPTRNDWIPQWLDVLKHGGSTPPFDVLAKTREYTALQTVAEMMPYYADDYVFRGSVVGPITAQDVADTQSGFNLVEAYPDLDRGIFGLAVDPNNPYRVLFFERWTATNTGPLKVGPLTIPATGKRIETPIHVTSLVWNPEGKIVYQAISPPVDRFEGSTKGAGAIFGLLAGAGVDQGTPAVGSPWLMLQQRLANGRLGKLWSDEDRIPAWWRSAARGADPNDI